MSRFIKQNMTSRSWILTHDIVAEPWTFPKTLPKGIKYMIGQLEKGEKNGRLHYQIYLQTTDSVGPVAVKKLLGTRTTHVERIKKSDAAAKNYCMKKETRQDGPWELKPQPIDVTKLKEIEKDIWKNIQCNDWVPGVKRDKHGIVIDSLSDAMREEYNY